MFWCRPSPSHLSRFEQPSRDATSPVHWVGGNRQGITFPVCAHPPDTVPGRSGLDYHYMNSPAEVQKSVLRRQLKHAVALGKPVTIHTREADEDIEAILVEELPSDHKVFHFCKRLTTALYLPI